MAVPHGVFCISVEAHLRRGSLRHNLLPSQCISSTTRSPCCCSSVVKISLITSALLHRAQLHCRGRSSFLHCIVEALWTSLVDTVSTKRCRFEILSTIPHPQHFVWITAERVLKKLQIKLSATSPLMQFHPYFIRCILAIYVLSKRLFLVIEDGFEIR